ncbi:hypothetical protein PVK06_020499 [Gossypium arboreum]|uniref:Uncharacterized protein n=1 Tax=Gossypium arboreum TaxID=29729 RepID=A0ABR0PMI5_GOSAR|nr:hypothetical protein PVK06_020499 [Gossypium arboreum]
MGLDHFLKITLPTYINLVRAFYSNAKLEHDESDDTMITITSFFMNTPIRLTLDEFGNPLHFPYKTQYFITSGHASELNVYDRVLHLIITWNLHVIKKHAMLCSTDCCWIDSVQFDRCPNLTLIMFNDITKAIGTAMSTNLTLLYGTCLFRKLGIDTLGDIPITTNQPISFGALHHAGFYFDANFGNWIKSGATHEDDHVEGPFKDASTLEHVPSPKHVHPPTALS